MNPFPPRSRLRRPTTHDCPLGAHLQRRAGAGRRGGLGDDGFSLIETVVSISLIVLVMAAFSTFFVNTVAFTGQQRSAQMATRIANSAMETLRALPAARLAVADDTTLTGVVGRDQLMDRIPFQTEVSAPWCDIRSEDLPNVSCEPTGGAGTGYRRATVTVTWSGPRCTETDCSYRTSTVLNAHQGLEPRFGVDPSLEVTAPETQASSVGDPDTLSVTVTGGSGTVSWSGGDTLPAGMTLTPDGKVSGTPTTAGVSTVVLAVTDGKTGAARTTTFDWVVHPAFSVPDPGSQTSAVGDADVLTVSVVGGSDSFTWAGGESLPAGMTLTPDGMVSGTPTAAGATTVTLVVTDNQTAVTRTVAFSWTVHPAFSLTGPGSQASSVGSADSLSLAGAGAGGSGSVVWSGGETLPAGLTLAPAGVVSGTPTTAGERTVNLVATDVTAGVARTVAFSWTVYARLSTVNPGPQESSVGDADSLSLAGGVAGGSGSVVWSGGETLPAGLALSPAGEVVGTPTTAGGTSVTLVATDPRTEVARPVTFTWTVHPAFTVTNPADQSSEVDEPDSLSLAGNVAGGSGSIVWTGGETLPAGMSLSSAGEVAGTPTTAGSTSVTLVATDPRTEVARSLTFTWTVYPAFSIVNPGDQTSVVGDPDTLSLTVAGGSVVWTAGATLPAGLSVTPAGLVSGTPTTVGTSSVTLVATDPMSGAVRTVRFGWRVYPAFSVADPGAQSSGVGSPDSLSLVATGGSGSVVWSGGETLPSGLLLTPSGSVSGTPTTAGTSSVTLVATDPEAGAARTVAFDWAVYPAFSAVNPGAQSSNAGAADSLTLAVVGGSGAVAWSGGETLPAGLSLTPAGLVSGTPTTAGTSSVTLMATDSRTGVARTVGFPWTVYPAFSAVIPGAQSSSVGAPDSLALGVTGGSGSVVWTGGATLPAGLALTPAGVVSGTPTTAGTTSVSLVATDSRTGVARTVGFSWTVYPALSAVNPGAQASSVGAADSLALTVMGGSGSIAWTGGATLPAGLSMTPAGMVSGIPTTVGTTSVALVATDTATGVARDVAFTWTVHGGPTVTAPAAQQSTVGADVSLQVVASCPNVPCTYQLKNGPATLGISAGGLITGTTTSNPQTFAAVTVTITDAGGAAATSAAFRWVVVAGGQLAPQAPRSVTAQHTNGNQYLVFWSAPAFDGGSPITSYTVRTSSGRSCTTTTTLSCSINGVKSDSVTVTATNAIGVSPPATGVLP